MEKAIKNGDFSSPSFDLARTFVSADEIVIAAPYWDMSFPAFLKLYIEQLCVNKLTFYYNEKGIPCGLTNVKKLVYLTTSGGYIGNNNFGFDYIKAVMEEFYHIPDVKGFFAEKLDLMGSEPTEIMQVALDAIDKFFEKQ